MGWIQNPGYETRDPEKKLIPNPVSSVIQIQDLDPQPLV
jgi:hypothetical protein